MKKTISLLLALVLLLSLIPMAASAAKVNINGYDRVTHIQQAKTGGFVSTYQFSDGTQVVVKDGKVTHSNHHGIHKDDVIGHTHGKHGKKETWIAAHQHDYEWTVNRDGHFYRCACGTKNTFAEHTMESDGKCICGYTFMDNADLTVLWMRGIKLSPSFSKDVTEYEGKLQNKNLKETKISAFSFDAKAEIELPEDLTLNKGTNTFEIKVTAEDGKTTKTYTVKVEVE